MTNKKHDMTVLKAFQNEEHVDNAWDYSIKKKGLTYDQYLNIIKRLLKEKKLHITTHDYYEADIQIYSCEFCNFETETKGLKTLKAVIDAHNVIFALYNP